jgi:hypothetical protein
MVARTPGKAEQSKSKRSLTMVKHVAVFLFLCVAGQLVLAQQHTTFAGQPSLQFDVAPNLSVYASACKYDDEAAICYDVSYGRIASAGRALLSMAGGLAAGGDAGTVGNILDEAPHNGTLFVTASKVVFAPVTDKAYTWDTDRNQLTVKHQKNWGEELKAKPQNLHGILNFRPRDSNGQFAWSNGAAAKALVAKNPEDRAARFLEYFFSSVNDFSGAYARIVN